MRRHDKLERVNERRKKDLNPVTSFLRGAPLSEADEKVSFSFGEKKEATVEERKSWTRA